ncbi:2-nitropropane dioxygenase [Rubrivivax gelatinosus]|nr:2-nitropropane dioxygenase [Rubrivivax gelatinosus]
MKIPGAALPLIQAPMAGVQDARLALAAGAAGALGSLPAAMLSPPKLEAELQALQAAGRPYNVNFFAHRTPAADDARAARWAEALAPYRTELGLPPDAAPAAGASRQPFDAQAAEVLEAFRPAVISFHFGLPAPALLARVKARGAFVIASATTLAEALWLQASGADAVIAQGLEAGGHRGHFLDTDPARQLDTATLVSALVARLAVPVVAAGGIGDADGVRAMMARGASAVQLGTVFLLCDEALTGPLHRARLREPSAPTVLTNVFSGGLARGLVNRAVRDLGPVSALAPPFPLASAALAPLRERAEALGRDDFTPLWSGTRRDGCREQPAGEIVCTLAAAFD